MMTGTRELRIAPAIVRMESTRPARRVHLNQQSGGALAVRPRDSTLKQFGAYGLNRLVEHQLFDNRSLGAHCAGTETHQPNCCNQAEG